MPTASPWTASPAEASFPHFYPPPARSPVTLTSFTSTANREGAIGLSKPIKSFGLTKQFAPTDRRCRSSAPPASASHLGDANRQRRTETSRSDARGDLQAESHAQTGGALPNSQRFGRSTRAGQASGWSSICEL